MLSALAPPVHWQQPPPALSASSSPPLNAVCPPPSMAYTNSLSYWLVGLIATAWLVRKKLVPLYMSPLLSLRGPPSASILYGNFQQVGKVADPLVFQRWMEDYGSTFLARIYLLVRCSFCYVSDASPSAA